MKYFEDRDFFVKEATFNRGSTKYAGSGFIHWSPQKGFNVKLMAKCLEAPQKQTIAFGKPKLVKKSDRKDIELKIDGYDKAVIPNAYIHNNLGLLINNTLDVNTSSLFFYTNSFKKSEDVWLGRALYKLPKSRYSLPERISKSESIKDVEFKSGASQSGIYSKRDDLSLSAYLEDNQYLYLHFSLNKEKYSKDYAERFIQGINFSLVFLLGVEVYLLFSEFNDNERTVLKVNKENTPINLRIYQTVFELDCFKSNDLVDLSLFFTKAFTQEKNNESLISVNTIKQIVEAEKQKDQLTTEFLIASNLEAVLRTSLNIAFKKGGKYRTLSVQNELSNFKKKYELKKDWDQIIYAVNNSFDNLRHRSAHPDWLFEQHEPHSDEGLIKTFHDVMILMSFYRYIIWHYSGKTDFLPTLPEKLE